MKYQKKIKKGHTKNRKRKKKQKANEEPFSLAEKPSIKILKNAPAKKSETRTKKKQTNKKERPPVLLAKKETDNSSKGKKQKTVYEARYQVPVSSIDYQQV